jgi:hypothetical protein
MPAMPMLSSGGSGKVLMVVGLLVAVALMSKAKPAIAASNTAAK